MGVRRLGYLSSALGMIEGEGEHYRENLGAGLQRLFTYYSKEELEGLLQANGFTVQHFDSILPGSGRYIHFICTTP